MSPSPARRRRLLARTATARGTDYAKAHPAYVSPDDTEPTDDGEAAAAGTADADSEETETAAPAEPPAARPASADLLPATVQHDGVRENDEPAAAGEHDRQPGPLTRRPAAPAAPPATRPRVLPPVAANPEPLPEPLPPRLDAVVRRLREDLLSAGGDAAALADEICARHRDRLREALGLVD